MDKDVALMEFREKNDGVTKGNEKVREKEALPDGDGGSKTLDQFMAEWRAYAESLPDPNEGRIQELRDLIHKGKLITKEAIRETAEKLVRQFLGS